MSHVGYLVVGWGVAVLVLAAYALSLVLRGRAIAPRVPLARRRWMTSEEEV